LDEVQQTRSSYLHQSASAPERNARGLSVKQPTSHCNGVVPLLHSALITRMQSTPACTCTLTYLHTYTIQRCTRMQITSAHTCTLTQFNVAHACKSPQPTIAYSHTFTIQRSTCMQSTHCHTSTCHTGLQSPHWHTSTCHTGSVGVRTPPFLITYSQPIIKPGVASTKLGSPRDNELGMLEAKPKAVAPQAQLNATVTAQSPATA